MLWQTILERKYQSRFYGTNTENLFWTQVIVVAALFLFKKTPPDRSSLGGRSAYWRESRKNRQVSTAVTQRDSDGVVFIFGQVIVVEIKLIVNRVRSVSNLFRWDKLKVTDWKHFCNRTIKINFYKLVWSGFSPFRLFLIFHLRTSENSEVQLLGRIADFVVIFSHPPFK